MTPDLAPQCIYEYQHHKHIFPGIVMKQTHLALRVILISVFLLQVTGRSRAQTGELVSLTPTIGDTLDRYERQLYDISFPASVFLWAVYFMDADSMLSVQMGYQRKFDQVTIVNMIPQHRQYRDLIDYIREKEAEFLSGEREGSLMIFALRSGAIVEGELIAVRDSVLLIDPRGRRRDSSRVLNRSEIVDCFLPGESKVGEGILVGSLVGAGLGFVVGLGSGDDDKGWIRFTKEQKGSMLALAALPIGALIGAGAGASSSTDDQIIDHSDTHLMKILSKYPTGEPESLTR